MSAIMILTSFCDFIETSRLTTKLRDLTHKQCFEEDAGHFCLSHGSTNFILYRLSRQALLKRVKMWNTLSGVQDIQG